MAEKVESKEGAKETEVRQPASKSQKILTKLKGGVKIEDKMDYALITEYLTPQIDVECGEKKADVYFYSHEDHMHEDFMDLYKMGLKKQIDQKKIILSKQEQRDVGPFYTIVRYIEEGDYDMFLAIFDILLSIKISYKLIEEGEYNHFLSIFDKPITNDACNQFIENLSKLVRKRKLQSLEHVFKVYDHDNGKTYHIMPAKYGAKAAFENMEQGGAIAVAIYKEFKEKQSRGEISEDICVEELERAMMAWISGNDKKNAKLFREILEDPSVRVKKIEQYDKELKGCVIFENALNRIKENFLI